MSKNSKLLATVLLAIGSLIPLSAKCVEQGSIDVSRGKYLIAITGCNDCHTSGYAPSGGAIPETEWLLGDQMGFRGPWGTTYAINLRDYINKISEDDWVKKARTLETRPPMPWWALQAMNDNDLRSIYAYIKSLEVLEGTVPSYVPQNEVPDPPYIQWPMPVK